MLLKLLQNIRYSLVVMLIMIYPNALLAVDPKLPTERTPISAVQEAQKEREQKTIELLRDVFNENNNLHDRQSAFSSLGGIEYDYILANGEQLVLMPAPLAIQAISTIGAAISMFPADHGHHHGEAVDQLSLYQDNLVKRSEAVLEKALEHTDDSVRLEASLILAARGNSQALVAIDGMLQNGSIGAREGIGYLSIAPTSIAAPFIEKYLHSDDSKAQAVAISQLAYNPSYTEQIREMVLMPSAKSEVTAAALPGLARTDSDFLEYGISLANNADVSTITREAALRESLDLLASTEQNAVTGTIARTLKGTSLQINTEAASAAYQAYEQYISNQKNQ